VTAVRTTAPGVYLITGPMAAGKTTVAGLLARRFERGVHLEGDVFRRSIVTGREEMTQDPSEQALEQPRLRYRLAASAADAYVDAVSTSRSKMSSQARCSARSRR
jgi:adenylylsulfate kinase-like enzyme